MRNANLLLVGNLKNQRIVGNRAGDPVLIEVLKQDLDIFRAAQLQIAFLNVKDFLRDTFILQFQSDGGIEIGYGNLVIRLNALDHLHDFLILCFLISELVTQHILISVSLFYLCNGELLEALLEFLEGHFLLFFLAEVFEFI